MNKPSSTKAYRVIPRLAAPFLFLLAALLTHDPHREGQGRSAASLISPMFYTSLADSVSPEYVRKIGLDHVTGIKFMPLNGRESHYFHYRADAASVLHALESLPFAIDVLVADTGVRPLGPETMASDLSALPAMEYERSSFFWDADMLVFRGYEVVKGKARHVVLVNPSTREILHRIVFG